MMKRFLTVLLVIGTMLGGFSSSILSNLPKPNKAEAYAWSTNNLASDGGFINVNGLNVNGVQSILNSTGGFLAGYSEGGRSAAQIIVDASHGYGGASGSINGITINTATGTINPVAILATLQKEQSLVYMKDRNDSALNAAMGYGCPDGGGCNPNYRGFTNQVEWGAWQLRYNYEAAGKNEAWVDQYYGSGSSFPWRPVLVGQTQDIDGQNVHIDNKTTSSLYRYTPHLGTAFSRYFEQWGGNSGLYQYQYISQSGNVTLNPGESSILSLKVKNKGVATWTPSVVRLGTSNPIDRGSRFALGADWLMPSRVKMEEVSVAPEEDATFVFNITAPANIAHGNYREYFRPVADGFNWMQDIGIYWNIRVPSNQDKYQYQIVSQSGYPTLNRGESTTLSLTIQNKGTATWTPNVVRLGTSNQIDRGSMFARGADWLTPNRVIMEEPSVAPEGYATFVFNITAPANISPGTYKEYFRPVADGYTWMQDIGIFWAIRVPTSQDISQYQYVSQSGYPTMNRGESTTLSLTLKNMGTANWASSIVRLGTNKPTDRTPVFTLGSGWIANNRIRMQGDSVVPGGNATFTFDITVPADMAPGTYREYFRPVADGYTWMQDIGIYWDVVVR